MKRVLLFLGIIACALGASGCGSVAAFKNGTDHALVQRLLDEVLPPNFHGDVHVYHKNPWFDGQIDAGNVRKVDGYWSFTWFSYVRNGRASNGNIRLGEVPLQRLVP